MQRAKRRSPLRQSCPGVGGSNPPLSAATHLTQREIYRGVGDMKMRFDEVLYDLEQERLRVDEDLRRLAVVAAYLRTLLLPPGGVAACHNDDGAATLGARC